jgi:hypothetical protein
VPERELTQEEIAALPAEVRQAMGLTATPEREATPDELAAAGVTPAPPPKPREPISRLRALANSAFQGYVKGGGDELAGARLRSMVDPERGRVDYRMPDGSERRLRTTGDAYRAGRDKLRDDLSEGEKAYPWMTTAADMAGDIASDATLRLAGVPGVGSMPYNAVVGGFSGLLRTDADLSDGASDEDLARTGVNTGAGAALGAVLPKVGEKLAPPVMRALSRFLQNRAVSQGTKALLSGTDVSTRKLAPKAGDVLEALRMPPEGGVPAILPFGTATGASQRLERMAADRGEVYASILTELERAGVTGPDAAVLARELADEAARRRPRVGANEAVPNAYQAEADKLASLADDGPHLGLTQAEDIKRALQEEPEYDLVQNNPVNRAKEDIARRVRLAIEQSVEDGTSSAPPDSPLRELGENFVPVKQQLGRTIGARDAAKIGAARSQRRRGGPNFMAATAMGASDPLDAYAKGAGWSILSERLPSTFASSSYAGSRLADALATPATGNALGRAGGRQLTGVDELLDLLYGPQDEAAALAEALRSRKE